MEERPRSSDVPWWCYLKDITLHPGPVGNEMKELTGDVIGLPVLARGHLGVVLCGSWVERCVYIQQPILLFFFFPNKGSLGGFMASFERHVV